MYKLRDRATLRPIYYAGDPAQGQLQNADPKIADELAAECGDYGIDAEVIEVDE